jgi:hypothetical protein
MQTKQYTWQGWQLAALWVLANTLGWAATGALAEFTPEMNALLGLVLVASAQWVALRERVPGGGYFVLLTYVAGFIGSLLGAFSMRILQFDFDSTVSIGWNVFLWGMDGLVVGAAQALLMRNWMMKPLLWVGASGLAFALASAPAQIVRASVENWNRIAGSTVFGLVSGIVTGALIWWVSNQE